MDRYKFKLYSVEVSLVKRKSTRKMRKGKRLHSWKILRILDSRRGEKRAFSQEVPVGRIRPSCGWKEMLHRWQRNRNNRICTDTRSRSVSNSAESDSYISQYSTFVSLGCIDCSFNVKVENSFIMICRHLSKILYKRAASRIILYHNWTFGDGSFSDDKKWATLFFVYAPRMSKSSGS